MNSRWRLLPVILLVAGVVAACVPGPTPKEVEYRIRAASDLNPDAGDRSSPIVVRFYELKSSGIFEGTDFFSLYEDDVRVLGQELVARKEFEIGPGESRKITESLQPETRIVGIVAAYRRLDEANWRAVFVIKEGDKTPIDVYLGRLGVVMESPEQ